MLVKGSILALATVVLVGCNGNPIQPELVDRSGKYDGNMIMAFHSRGTLQAYGRQHFTCNTAAYDDAYWIDDGEVYLPGKYSESVGSVSKDGNFYINYESGNYTDLDTGRKTPSFTIVEGQFESGLEAKGEMVIGKFRSTTGCKYDARGFIYKNKEDKQKLNPFYSIQSMTQNINLTWGGKEISGKLVTSEKARDGALVDIAFISTDNKVACYGSLNMITDLQGRWKINCGDASKASGTFTQTKSSWKIIGKDSEDRFITASNPIN